MNLMKCTDKLFIINITVFHQKIRIVHFDFMPTLSCSGLLVSYRQVSLIKVGAKLCRTVAFQDQG